MLPETISGGTGSRLARATVIVAGVASLVATLLSLVSIWLQTKNYRKPLLQRYVVRIMLMVPIYSISSWASIVSLRTSSWLVPIRDIYEAFTIYTFFQLLINFLGGERALIIMTHGRPPVQHAWPLNHCLAKVDISDPHTFLAIKRGILQYTWLKPILGIISIIMKATNTYQEGYLGLTSGYLWTGIVYNISVSVSLYSLAMFWVCMHEDLKPFRPVPKFLCVKLIIFASYWQGFFLSILQWLGAIPNGPPGYTPDNLAAAIQDSLICFEMPIFAVAHWYAFSWHDYANPRISAARMPVKYAIRDAFGIRDLIEDTKETFRGENYQYRAFDSGDNVIAHEESNSRVARMMDGMRYERGGKAKYWIPKPGEVNSRTPLLSDSTSSHRGSRGRPNRGSGVEAAHDFDDIEEISLNEEDETLFLNARALEFGDWNYPVITANEVSIDQGFPSGPDPVHPATQRSFPGATRLRKAMKHTSSRITDDQALPQSTPGESSGRSNKRPTGPDKRQGNSSLSTKSLSAPSQLVDITDDMEAAEQEGTQNIGVEPIEDEQCQVRFVERSPGGSKGTPETEPNKLIARDSEESCDEGPLGRNMAYGAFNEERDAWNSSDSYATSSK